MSLGSPQSFEVVPMLKQSLPAQNPNAVLQFYVTAGELQRAVRGANGKVDEVLSQLGEIKQSLEQSSKGSAELLSETRGL